MSGAAPEEGRFGSRARAALLGAVALLTLALVPREQDKAPFDPVWRQRVAAEHPDLVVLGNCLVAELDERVLDGMGVRAMKISLGGTFPREWYLLLAHSVLVGPRPPPVVVIPYAGGELGMDLGASDAAATRRTERLVPDDAPADPVYDAVAAPASAGAWVRARLARHLFRPSSLAPDAERALQAAVLGLTVPPAAIPPPRPRMADTPEMEQDDSPLGRWRVGGVNDRMNQEHFRAGLSFDAPSAADTGLDPAVRIHRTFLPAIVDLAAARGTRVVFAHVNRGVDADRAFDAYAATWLEAHGARVVDMSAEAPTHEQRANGGRGDVEGFTRLFVDRAGAALR